MVKNIYKDVEYAAFITTGISSVLVCYLGSHRRGIVNIMFPFLVICHMEILCELSFYKPLLCFLVGTWTW